MRSDKTRALALTVLMALLIFASLSLSACSTDNPVQVVLTTGFSKEEVFRIESKACMRPEVLVYLTNIQNRYENIYGGRIWEMETEGGTLEGDLKNTVLYRLAQLKVMVLMAEKYEVFLTSEEESEVHLCAEEYYNSLTEMEREYLEAKIGDIESMYREYALADKIYHYIIKDVNPEISDDEARIITVGRILIKTYEENDSGERVPFGIRDKETAYERAVEIHREATQDEESDFEDLTVRFNEAETGILSFGKGEMDKAFEDEAFKLETGEIGSIVENSDGYNIIKCITTFNRQETDENKERILNSKRRQVFGEEYSTFADTLTRILNEDMWNDIAITVDENVTTDSFFSIYNSHFEGKFDRYRNR